MDLNRKIKEDSYFQSRQVDAAYYAQVDLPLYLKDQLPSNKGANILDIGCGLGQMLAKFKEYGY
jgi:ubiquinone/menaquinone biosynthesis C-methylase UbiE